MIRQSMFRFKLYVAGDAQNSMRALSNLNAVCNAHLAKRHEIEVIDVFKEPARALADGIFMTPTLVKLTPAPVCRIVGTLSQTQTVVDALGLPVVAT